MKDEMMKRMMNEEDGREAGHEDAKMQVLEELREMAMSMMGDKMKHKLSPMEEMKKVTVASPDQEGLEEGLEMASEVIPDMEEAHEDMDLDQIEEEIRRLEEMKRSKMMEA